MFGEDVLGAEAFGGANEPVSQLPVANSLASAPSPTLSGGNIIVPIPLASAPAVARGALVGPRLFAARDGSWFGNQNSVSDLYIIDPSTGTPTSVGPIGFCISAMAFDPTDNTLYASTSYSSVAPLSLITIDPSTGAGTLIGAHTLISGFQELDGMAFKQDGTLYGFGGQGGGSHLYQIDKATGALTDLGNNGFGWSGEAIVMDASDTIYFLPPDFDGAEIGLIKTSPYSITQIAAIQNGDEVLAGDSGDDLVDGSFSPNGTMYVIDRFADTVMTLQPDGTLALVGAIGALDPGATDNVHDFAALAWLAGAPPTQWFTFPDFQELFDVAPLDQTPASYSTPTDPLISQDGAAEGASSFKVDAASDDQYIEYLLPTSTLEGYGWPLDTEWVYLSFALYVPSFTSSSQYADLFSFGKDIYIYTDGTVGYLRIQMNSDDFSSPTFSAGAWHTVQIAYLANDGTGHWAIQFWIDGVTNGVQNSVDTSSASSMGDLYIGDYSHGGDGTDLLYYFDSFTWSMIAMPPPVDLTNAFFSGVGAATDYDAITGEAKSGHPVDDSYTALVDRPLIVPGSIRDPTNYSPFFPNYFAINQQGVLANDGLATTATLNTGPTHGTLVYFNSDGSFRYDPDPGYVGVDTFTYDGNGGTATVTITIVEVTALHPVFDNHHGFREAA